MEFKVGDRVHVTKLDNKKVNFYATLNSNPSNPACFKLDDCSNSSHKEKPVWKIVTEGSCDYYTLATDKNKINEQDMIEKLIREKKDLLKEIERLEEDNKHLCKLVYETYKELFKYRILTDNIKNKYKTKPGRYSDLMDIINEMEEK